MKGRGKNVYPFTQVSRLILISRLTPLFFLCPLARYCRTSISEVRVRSFVRDIPDFGPVVRVRVGPTAAEREER